jgi:hypothetical protein
MIAKMCFKNPRFPEFRTGCKDRRQVVRLLRYIQKESGDGVCLHNDFGGEDPLQIADEVNALDRGHKYKGFHFILSVPIDEQPLWEPKTPELLQSFKKLLKASKIYARSHLDKKEATWHVHVYVFGDDAAGRQLRLRGKRPDGSESTTPELLRQWCMKVEDETPGCKKTGRGGDGGGGGGDKEKHEMAFSKDELEMAARRHKEGKRPTAAPDKLVLRLKVDQLVRRATSIEDLQSRGNAAGVEVRVTEYANGKGISFSDGITSLRGRDCGWTHSALEKLYAKNQGADPVGKNGIIENPGKGLRPDHRGGAGVTLGGLHRAPRQGHGVRAAGLRADRPAGWRGGKGAILSEWSKAVRIGFGKGGLPGLVAYWLTALMRLANDPGMPAWKPEIEGPLI